MSARLGLSSGTAPGLSAAELAELTRRAGGTVVDLRADKGHRWEGDGIAGLAGLPVAFVGLSCVLGRDGRDRRDGRGGDGRGGDDTRNGGEGRDGRGGGDGADTAGAHRFPGQAIKVFAAPEALESACTSRQIAELTRDRDPGDVLVETHRGYASPGTLRRLCERYGCRLVIDNLGLHEISGDFEADLAVLAPWARAVQVKGFGGEPTRHRSLTGADLTWLRLLGSGVTDLTVESRAGTPEEDVAVLDLAWKRVTCASP